uniref:Uncharacterized protein n=1 Tax=Rhizophora mucronata TaxID=61149 RepID=A0A2P2INM3_RHIMU
MALADPFVFRNRKSSLLELIY